MDAASVSQDQAGPEGQPNPQEPIPTHPGRGTWLFLLFITPPSTSSVSVQCARSLVTPLPFEGMRHVGRLGMGLLPSFRGQGLGRRLLREVLRQVFAKTLLRVELEVFASNKIAVGLYEREGFVIEGRKRSARFLDGAEDDILLMGCLRDEWLARI